MRFLHSRLAEEHLTRCLVVLRLVGSRIDFEKHVAGLYIGAFAKWHADQVAGHARNDVDRFLGFGPTGEVDVVGDFASYRLTDWDGGRGGGGDCSLFFCASANET